MMLSTLRTNRPRTFYIIVFSLVFLATRVPRLNSDIVSTDAIYWHDRSEKFIKHLKAGEYSETYQMYHPGVTLMWSTGVTSEVYSRLSGISVSDIFSEFLNLHFYAKLVLVLWQLGLSILIIHLLSKIFEFKPAFFMVLLFSVEPFFVGNSRLLHLDAQISLYILAGLALSYLNSKKFSYFGVIVAGILFGLAALSKTLFLGGIMFGLFAGGLMSFINCGFKTSLKYFLIMLVSFLATYFLLFPAFWVDYNETLSRIIDDSWVVGKQLGHKQFFFGEVVRDPGYTFYPIVLFLKVSLVTLVGFALFYWEQLKSLITKLRKRKIKFNLKNIPFPTFIGVFYLVYFLAISYFSKKIDRYTVSLFPFLGIIAVLGYYSTKIKKKAILVVLVLFSIVYPLVRVFPNYLTYINPIFGDADDGNKIIGQKLFGIGMFDLRDFIVEKYGPNTRVAINDTPSFKVVYGSGKVLNLSVDHPNSYYLMILGPNKKPPPAVVKSGVKFKYDDSVYINGLEFWRIYRRIN